MKISVVICLFVLVLTVPQLYSYNTKRDIQGGAGEELLFDNSNDECCQQNGTDVDMKKPGLVEVMLDGGNELIFEVCEQQCNGEFLACYESDPPNQTINSFISDHCDTKCGFYVSGNGNFITFTKPFTENYNGLSKKEQCPEMIMQQGTTTAFNRRYLSCAPKFSENGMVKLNVLNASSDCLVIIKNATVKPETTTALPTTLTTAPAAAGTSTEFKTKNGPSGNETETTAAPGSFFETYWWIFVIIVIFVVALVAAGIVIYCLKCKKPKKPTPTPTAALRMPPGPQSPAVLQASTENVKSRGLPSSILNPSSILSHKSLLDNKIGKEEEKQDETDLASLKPTA